MGRELKRVPLTFDWPINKTWWGYLVGWKMMKRLKEIGEAVECETCHGTGEVPWKSWDGDKPPYYCPHCEGEKEPSIPDIPVPTGEGYQMWETTSEGSPISPVFDNPEALAQWLADNGASSFGDMTATYGQWHAMIVGHGTACSAVISSDGIQSGVEAGT